MKLTLFSRLVIGYLALYVLVIAVSVYGIVQLRRVNDVIRSVLDVDNRVLDYDKQLGDVLLSQIRYERRYVIAKDDTLYNQFLLFKNDFEQYLDDAMLAADSHAKELLAKIKKDYEQYEGLFGREVAYLKASQSYPQSQYRQEKEKLTDSIMAELQNLKTYSEQSNYKKIRALAEAATGAAQVFVIITIASLIFGVTVSFLITRSINRPVSILKMKTREIAQGNFRGDLQLTSPPEMAELANAFNFMCHKLNELDKMKSEFFSTMSHELRTPLTSIKEGSGLLLEGTAGPITDKQRKVLAIVAEESSRLIHLVNSLLDISKMEAGMMTYNFMPTSLPPLIQKAMMEIMPLVESQKIRLEAKINEHLPALSADPERILQALRNLIGNAVKYTPEGGRVTVSAIQRDGKVEVSVADTGPGIPSDDLTSIFEKFKQGSQKGSRPFKGTGLGLAIVKHIILSHGGRIWAESSPGQGSTFFFVLPV